MSLDSKIKVAEAGQAWPFFAEGREGCPAGASPMSLLNGAIRATQNGNATRMYYDTNYDYH